MTHEDNAAALKSLSPGLIVIGRIYLAAQPQDGDPGLRAEQWWGQVNTTILASRAIDYWEGYNEPAAAADSMAWYAAFEVRRYGVKLSSLDFCAFETA